MTIYEFIWCLLITNPKKLQVDVDIMLCPHTSIYSFSHNLRIVVEYIDGHSNKTKKKKLNIMMGYR